MDRELCIEIFGRNLEIPAAGEMEEGVFSFSLCVFYWMALELKLIEEERVAFIVRNSLVNDKIALGELGGIIVFKWKEIRGLKKGPYLVVW